ncbi:hypothetical protein THIOKS12070046 [Thiocapsa sp. KS1]|nr:hypothetical protein THIOKS12070046 [Thiocapsa sp. KS1]
MRAHWAAAGRNVTHVAGARSALVHPLGEQPANASEGRGCAHDAPEHTGSRRYRRSYRHRPRVRSRR